MATIVGSAVGGNWNATGTWVGGVVPTAADNVQLTSSSGNVTINVSSACRSLDCTGYTGTLIHGAAIVLSIGDATAGSGNSILRLVAGMTYSLGNAATSAITLASSTATQQTITTAGKTVGNFIASGGGSYLLTDALTSTGTITHTQGTFNSGNFAINAIAFNYGNATARTLTLGSSTVTLSATSAVWTGTNTTNLTVTSNTATITLTGALINANVVILNGFNWQGLSFNFTGGGTPVISTGPGGTIGSLTYTGTAVKTNTFGLTGNVTITGTLSIQGNSATNRVLFFNTGRGTAATVTLTTLGTMANIDIMDITAAGVAGTWNLSAITGLSGDCGGNSNITFTTGVTAYYYNTASSNWSSSTWFTTTGGGGSATRVPLPQDDVIIDSNSSPTGGRTLTFDMPRLGKNLTTSGNSNGSQLGGAINVEMYGAWNNTDNTWGNSLTTLTITFAGRSTYSITMGQALGNTSLLIAAPGGTYTAATDLLGNATSTFTTRFGTFNTGNFTLSFSVFTFGNGTAHTVNLGTSTMNVLSQASTNVIVTSAATTLNASSSTFIITNPASVIRSISSGGAIYGELRYTVANSPGSLAIGTSSTWNNINIGSGRSINFASGGNFVVNSFPGSGMVNGYVYAPGDGPAATVPDSAALSITADMDFRVRMSLDDYASGLTRRIAAKFLTTGSQQSWRFTLASGTLAFGISTTGADLLAYSATTTLASVGLSTGTNYWLRFTREKTTGNVKFYYAADNVSMPSSWTQIGTTVVGSTSSIFDSTANLTIGGEQLGAGTNFTGKVYRAQLRDNILDNGTGIQLDADFSTKTVGVDTFTESSSNAATVTILNQSIFGDGRLAVSSSLAGTAVNISKLYGGAITTADYLKVQDIKFLQPYMFYAGANSVNVSGNTNVNFTVAPSAPLIRQSAPLVTITSSTSGTATYPVATAAGNLLICMVGASSTLGTTTPPTGWTQADVKLGTAHVIMFYKVATGSETTVTPSWTNSVSPQMYAYEIENWAGKPPSLDTVNESTSAAATSLTTGTAANSSSPGISIVAFSANGSLGASSTIPTNSFQEDYSSTQGTGAVLKWGLLPLTSVASQSTTFTWSTTRVPVSVVVNFIAHIHSLGSFFDVF